MSAPKWAKGMRRIGPGIYVNGRELHLSHEEIASSLGVPLTPETARLIEETARETVRELLPGVPVEERGQFHCAHCGGAVENPESHRCR